MAKQGDRRDADPLEQVVLAQSVELEALLNVLERRGRASKAEILEELRWLRAEAPQAR